MSSFILHTRDTAPKGSHGVMDAYAERFGFVPNLINIMAESPAATQGYAHTYGLLAETDFSPAEQQLLFLTISRTNGCTYCVSAHTMAATMVGLDNATIDAVRDGRPILDPKLAALSSFAIKVVEKRGHLNRDDINDFLTAGYSRAQILEVLLAVATKTISNYMNHIAHTPLDEPFAAAEWSPSPQAA
ncbi:carboxymuconolactone decarboxylase family protein [Magnetovibrio sp.]|uniref:carboxymuconolactone decarboxylase family protein n=1 Tax=Magnetovibrio sp. TaxID=2024836 RepID=UPI002F93C472